jgi:hypothetical protein
MSTPAPTEDTDVAVAREGYAHWDRGKREGSVEGCRDEPA